VIQATVGDALEELRAFQLTPLGELGMNQEADRLMLLASEFGRSTKDVGARKELERRATLYEQSFARDGPFEAARVKALQFVSANLDKLQIDDHEEGPIRVELQRMVSIDDQKGNRRVIPAHVKRFYPNYTLKICQRWGDTNFFMWHLEATLRDADDLLVFDSLDEQLWKALVKFRGMMSQLLARAKREHLFGCFLIVRCLAALDSDEPVRSEYNSVASRLRADAGRYSLAIRKAAEALAAGSAGRRAGAERRSNTWCYLPKEKRPEEFNHGPLAGTQRQLAKAICPSTGVRPNIKALKTFAGNGLVWVTKISGQSYEAWFRDESRFRLARQRLETFTRDAG
jgi:hypothetical protein